MIILRSSINEMLRNEQNVNEINLLCMVHSIDLQSWPKVYDHPDFLQYFVI